MRRVKANNLISAFGLLLVASLAWPCAARAGLNDAPKKVREGIEHFDAGQFDKASAAFDEARKIQPEDARVTFDAACAKAAAGDFNEAMQLFQQAAVTPDVELAARCHYNLGLLAMNRAKAALGDKPDAAEPDAREKAREAAAAAISHWRDCLAMRPDHADARYNLELTDQWLDHIDRVWKEADRKKRFEKMSLFEMLQWFDKEQGGLRSHTRAMHGREPSPRYRLDLHQAAGRQRDLVEDVGPLKQKIVQQFNRPQPSQGTGQTPGAVCTTPGECGGTAGDEFAAMDSEQRERAAKLLSGLADQASESMQTAAEHLNEQSIGDAAAGQAQAIEQLDQINTVVTPYQDLVFREVDRQKKLVAGAVSDVPSVGAAGQPAERDLPEAAWQQRFVERWTPILVAKAKQGLKSLPPPEAKSPASVPPAEKSEPATKSGGKIPPVAEKTPADSQNIDPQEVARRQRENLRKSMELAVELGPEVERLTARAAADLDDSRPADAMPKQKEALRLLEKIAEPLKQPNQNKQNQNQQNQDKKDKKDQDKKDQKDNKDQQQNNHDKKDQTQQKKDDKKDQKQDQEKKEDQNKQNQNAGNQPQPPRDKNHQPAGGQMQRQPRDLNKQQAEALVQQVRQRAREKEKARKMLIERFSRPPKPEKDW